MSIPFRQKWAVTRYILKQKIRGTARYPLVLMLEPLFRCNLACAGCGKIDYPDPILQQQMSVPECLAAADECDAPIVSIAGGEPLLHKDIGDVVSGLIKQKRFVYFCTNALLLLKKRHLFEPSDYLTFSIHLDGNKKRHDDSVCQKGVYDRVITAIDTLLAEGFRVNVNCTLFEGPSPSETAAFFDTIKRRGVHGITVSPGYAYERAPDQNHFLNRRKTKNFFRKLFAITNNPKKDWGLSHSFLYLDFLAGNQDYRCTPWGNPTRNFFGWQRPCYLLGEGYAPTFRSLMDDTSWDHYGTGHYEKCADCMAHCGYEATAANDAIRHPWKEMLLALKGIRLKGRMAKEIDMSSMRPAQHYHETHVERMVAEIEEQQKSSQPQLTTQAQKSLAPTPQGNSRPTTLPSHAT